MNRSEPTALRPERSACSKNFLRRSRTLSGFVQNGSTRKAGSLAGLRGRHLALQSSLCLDVVRETVEDGLPSSSLLLDGMGLLTIEGYPHLDAGWGRNELDLSRALAEQVFDGLGLFDFRVGSSEVESHAAVLRLHA